MSSTTPPTNINNLILELINELGPSAYSLPPCLNNLTLVDTQPASAQVSNYVLSASTLLNNACVPAMTSNECTQGFEIPGPDTVSIPQQPPSFPLVFEQQQLPHYSAPFESRTINQHTVFDASWEQFALEFPGAASNNQTGNGQVGNSNDQCVQTIDEILAMFSECDSENENEHLRVNQLPTDPAAIFAIQNLASNTLDSTTEHTKAVYKYPESGADNQNNKHFSRKGFGRVCKNTVVKRYHCTICDKYFTRPSSLNTHMLTHTGEKPHECQFPGCGRSFSVVSNLRRHGKVHGPTSLDDRHRSMMRRSGIANGNKAVPLVYYEYYPPPYPYMPAPFVDCPPVPPMPMQPTGVHHPMAEYDIQIPCGPVLQKQIPFGFPGFNPVFAEPAFPIGILPQNHGFDFSKGNL